MRNFTHPDVLPRMCDEIERVAWPIDREFEDSGRKCWIRRAADAEIIALEAVHKEALPKLPAGYGYYMAVKVLRTGVRFKFPFGGTIDDEQWRTLPEIDCSRIWDRVSGQKK